MTGGFSEIPEGTTQRVEVDIAWKWPGQRGIVLIVDVGEFEKQIARMYGKAVWRG